MFDELLEKIKRVDEKFHTYDFHCNSCGYDDELKSERAPKFCPKCGSDDTDWYLLEKIQIAQTRSR